MRLKIKIATFVVLAVLSLVVFFYLPKHAWLVPFYDEHIFYPFQAFRGRWFDIFHFSLGDIIYVAAGAGFLATLIEWIFLLFGTQQHRERLSLSFMGTLNGILFVYLFFVVGWGANYYKPPLATSWQLTQTDSALQQLSKEEFRQMVRNDLVAFDTFLVGRINEYAPGYRSLTFEEINHRAVGYYHRHTDTRLKDHGLGIKPTFFGYFMERLGVEGYYNPFTGEGQVNSDLPAFVLPFLVCHEIAHQAGIAAEGDANLMAYAVGTATDDASFRYSCYLQIWLYTNRKLYYRDSAAALRLEAQLNDLTVRHLDTLEQISRKYDNKYARYSSDLFDAYLKMQDQKEGIRSYSNVAINAWRLEQRRVKGAINIP